MTRVSFKDKTVRVSRITSSIFSFYYTVKFLRRKLLFGSEYLNVRERGSNAFDWFIYKLRILIMRPFAIQSIVKLVNAFTDQTEIIADVFKPKSCQRYFQLCVFLSSSRFSYGFSWKIKNFPLIVNQSSQPRPISLLSSFHWRVIHPKVPWQISHFWLIVELDIHFNTQYTGFFVSSDDPRHSKTIIDQMPLPGIQTRDYVCH